MTTVHITEDRWYRISTSDNVPAAPDRTMRSFGTFDVFEGDIIVDTGTTTSTVDITAEACPTEPELPVADGGFAEVVETSVTFTAGRLRVLAADGSEVLALNLNNGPGDYRLRLYSRYLSPRDQTHLLRVWPSASAREWHYQLDDEGQPIARPDRSATETLTVSMTVEESNIVALETQEMALAETQNGDIDDIVEDCLQICEIVKYRTEPSGQVTLALTARQWKVVLAVLDHYGMGATEPGEARALRQTHRLITAQIGDDLPPGRVYGL